MASRPSRPVVAAYTALAAVLSAAALSACCGPSKCVQARSGTAILDTVVIQIEKYKDRTGKYPIRLEDISQGYQDHANWEFKEACRECTVPEYRTDSYGYELEFRYTSFGNVRCLHTNEGEAWSCKGTY